MPASFLSFILKNKYQSITLEDALDHLDFIETIKSHCALNADLTLEYVLDHRALNADLTLEDALDHLELIETIKSHCALNADLHELIKEDFEEKFKAGQINIWDLKTIDFFIEIGQAIKEGALESLEKKLGTPILSTRLDPEIWFNWLTKKRSTLINELGFDSKHIKSLLERMENDLYKLRTLHPDQYEESGSIDDEFSPEFLFKKMGDFWIVRFKEDRKGINLKDSLGMDYICNLLMKPNDPIWSKELYDINKGILRSQAKEFIEVSNDLHYAEKLNSQEATKEEDYEIQLERKLQKNAYRELKNFDKEIKDAEEDGDMKKADKLKDELDKTLSYLKTSRNIRGGVRKHLNAEEIARQNVQKNIKRAIDNMRKKNLHNLADHLKNYLLTGSPCVYRPPIEKPPDWNF